MTGAPQADGLAGPDGDRKPSASALSGSIPSALPIVSSCRAFALQCKPYGVARVLNDSADTIEELYADAEFLCARLRELEGEFVEDDAASAEFFGHVIPALARMEDALAKARGEQQ